MRLLAAIALAATGWTQTPVRLAVNCTLEQVQKLDLSCSAEDPCPLYLELSDAEMLGDRIVLAGNIHTSAETLESILLISDDAGKNWSEAHARLPGAALISVQFFDFESGWISGHLLHRDARDPFLMLSTDGGKTWRRRPVYSEPKTGAVEQFRFTSKTSGVMLVDRGRGGESGLRYELWESFAGGESWNIRQVDARPISFPLPERGPKPLRLRIDAASKTYRLEKQDGAQWRAMASFGISLNPCRPEPPEVKEPPPEPEPEPELVKPVTPPPSLKGPKK